MKEENPTMEAVTVEKEEKAKMEAVAVEKEEKPTMEAVTVEKEENGGENVDLFSHLLDEIVVIILEKVIDVEKDAKALLCLSAVSKRFYTFVSQRVQSVKLNITQQALEIWGRFKIGDFQLKWLDKMTLEVPMCLFSLDYFSALKSAEIVVPSEFYRKEKFFVKWYTVFGAKLVKQVVLTYKATGLVNDPERFLGFPNFKVFELISKTHLKVAMGWFCFVPFLIRNHSKLENVVITDPENKGKVFVNREGVSELRELLASATPEHVALECLDLPGRLKQWYHPIVKLPSSGCSVKEVILTMYRPGVDNGGGVDAWEDEEKDACALSGAFEWEEDGMVGEAVAKIQRNFFRSYQSWFDTMKRIKK